MLQAHLTHDQFLSLTHEWQPDTKRSHRMIASVEKKDNGQICPPIRLWGGTIPCRVLGAGNTLSPHVGAGCTKGLILKTFIKVIFMKWVLSVFIRFLQEVIKSYGFVSLNRGP